MFSNRGRKKAFLQPNPSYNLGNSLVRFFNVAILLIVSVLGFNSCELTQPYKEAPAYVRIDSIGFLDTLSAYNGRIGRGRHHQRITDAWVFANGQFMGAFELPATVPVTITGPNVRLTIEPGVVADGQRGSRVTYPFFTRYNESMELLPGADYRINPTVHYNSNNNNLAVPMPLYEDFEDTLNKLMVRNPNSKVPLYYSTDPRFVFQDSGKVSGLLLAQDTMGLMLANARLGTRLPQDGSFVYLELVYKSNVPFTVGAMITTTFGTEGGVFDLNLLPTDRWTKVYVAFNDEIFPVANVLPQNSIFRFAIRGLASNRGDYIAFDNLKILCPRR